LDFIPHFPHIDACTLPSIIPPFSLTDMIYCTPEKNPMPASVQGVGVDC